MLYLTPAWAAKLHTTSNCSCLNKLSILSWSTRSILENRKELNYISAKRELEEEIGYKSNKIEFIANIHPAIGFANEKMNLFLATDLVQTKQNKDADEFIDLMPANLEKALELVWLNKITDVKTIIGILWFQKICNND